MLDERWAERIATFSIHGAQASERDVERLASEHMELLRVALDAAKMLRALADNLDHPSVPHDADDVNAARALAGELEACTWVTADEKLRDLESRLRNQRETIQEDDKALMALGAKLRECEDQRAILSDLLDRERKHVASLTRRLDRIADLVQSAKSARSVRSSSANSMKPTGP